MQYVNELLAAETVEGRMAVNKKWSIGGVSVAGILRGKGLPADSCYPFQLDTAMTREIVKPKFGSRPPHPKPSAVYALSAFASGGVDALYNNGDLSPTGWFESREDALAFIEWMKGGCK